MECAAHFRIYSAAEIEYQCLQLILFAASMAVNYYLDAEYRITLRKRIDFSGTKFVPLLLSSREIHTLTVYLSKQFLPAFTVEGYGGYSYDRQVGGACVPLYGATITIGNDGCLEGKFNYSHSTSTETSGIDVDRYQLELKYLF